ncbi:MAG: hypothetical protein HY781_13340 [Chloroflexi bacterium]|nr:hypothetical protein [Chloroflexota bacterium]
MQSRTSLTCLLLAALTACVPAVSTPPAPTASLGLPTVTQAETATITPELPSPAPPSVDLSPSPTAELLPTEPTMPTLPTLANPTMQATSIPQPETQSGVIQLFTPGPMSQVTSPVHFYGYAVPGYDDKGLIELYGEDGSLLASEILQLNTDYKWAFFSWSLPFDVRGAGELGRLTLSTRDQYGRLTAIQSVHLLLLPDGLEIINPPGSLAERCVIESPEAGKRITGGTVSVSGEMLPFNSLPLIVELVARDGSSLGSQLVSVSPGQEGAYLSFRVDMIYTVTVSTPVLLTVRQSDDRIGGTMYLYSQEIILNP